MVRYELLMLTVPEITKDETADLEKQLERCAKKNNSSVLSFERWGKYRLAYPVKKNEYGVYFLLRFETTKDVAGAFLTDIRTLLALKLNAIVMRDVIVRLAPDASLAYQRPESLEETPSADVDTFLRQNKMDGLFAGQAERSENVSHDSEDGSTSDYESVEA